ncbi:hypothetical protein AMATHDRAFT_50597 [Amanita thiersii Skay4041]|uniref:Uncharacterized protein n=1 Tax=Amanita thiersii Skay4041 TaxID=703135 RepID=A0A2A9NGY4_9AGAR|nr:hypothetical protein AMATHDRAFT_50597 [Amanita thiersii Skay4041]
MGSNRGFNNSESLQRGGTPSPPRKCFDAMIHWQGSQTTNPALSSLLKEASSFSVRTYTDSDAAALRHDGSPSKSYFSPTWQPVLSATTSSSNNTQQIRSTASTASLPRVTTENSDSAPSSFARTRSSIGSTSRRHDEQGKTPPVSPFTSHDPNTILEMMRGVSAIIDKNTGARSREYARSFSSSDLFASGGSKESKETMAYRRASAIAKMSAGGSLVAMREDEKMKMNASMGEKLAAVGAGRGQDKRKGKERERERSSAIGHYRDGNGLFDDEMEADADVSMMDISIMDVSMGDIDVGLSFANTASDPRRRESREDASRNATKPEMPPPPVPLGKIKATKSSPSSYPNSTNGRTPVRSSSSTSLSTHASMSATSALSQSLGARPTQQAEVKLHPLLIKKQEAKEAKRAQQPPQVNAVSSNVPKSTSAISSTGKAPPTRTASNSSISAPKTSGVNSSIPNPSQNRLQQDYQPPRLGMTRSHTSPFLHGTTSSSSANINTGVKTGTGSALSNSQAKSAKSYTTCQKPFRPPSRLISSQQAPAQASQSQYQPAQYAYYPSPRHVQNNTRNTTTTTSYTTGTTSTGAGSGRLAYPSPSPGSCSDDSFSTARTRGVAKQTSNNASASLYEEYRSASPFLPLTPESGDSSESSMSSSVIGSRSNQQQQQKQGLGEQLEEKGEVDPDSSFGDVSFDISMDALEETMKQYDDLF